MDSKQIKEKINEIEVPIEEVRQALKLGIEQADSKRRKLLFGKKVAIGGSILIVACLLLLFTLPIKTLNSLAKVPIVHSIIEFRSEKGSVIKEEGDPTPVGVYVTDQGIKLTIDTIYRDGGQIDISYSYEGAPDLLTIDEIDNYAASKSIQLADSNLTVNLPREQVKIEYKNVLRNEKNVYFGKIIINYLDPADELKETLPLIATEINGVKGKWALKVPLKEVKTTLFEVDKLIHLNDEVQMKIDKIVQGKTTTTIQYSVVKPKEDDIAEIKMGIIEPGQSLQVFEGNPSHLYSDFYPSQLIKKVNLNNKEERSIYQLNLTNPPNENSVNAAVYIDYKGENLSHEFSESLPIFFQGPKGTLDFELYHYEVMDGKLLVDIKTKEEKKETVDIISTIDKWMPKIYSSKKASEFSKNDRTLNVRQYEDESKELLANLKEFELHHTVVEQLDENDHTVRIIFDLARAIHPVTHESVTIHEITNDNLFSVYLQKSSYTHDQVIEIPIAQP